MDNNVVLTILVVGVVVFALLSYLFFMIFFPEWVGITGKKAREIQQSHVGEPEPKNEPEKNSSET